MTKGKNVLSKQQMFENGIDNQAVSFLSEKLPFLQQNRTIEERNRDDKKENTTPERLATQLFDNQ